ncbi:MAG: hypothetical protein H6730_34105 [Deltaproteobacteria bacterium]|nr:hypothetical protein [Deltaproteobacteria bacterium]
MPTRQLLTVLCAAALGVACGSTDPLDPAADTGVPADSGLLADAGVEEDSGVGADSGVDADSGAGVDSGVDTDSGVGADSGVGEDAAVEVDSGLPRPDAGALAPLPATSPTTQGRFTTSDTCAVCHSNHPNATAMRDSQARPIAPYDLWASSMMANAARDPFFRAVLSAEMSDTPVAHDALEDKCLTCHAPMAHVGAEDGSVHFSLTDLYTGTALGHLGLDGVSCAACHQISSTGLGTEDSFSGHFVVNATRTIYGPHSNLFSTPMVMRSGYTPQPAAHMTESAICATCHTLYTHAVDENGQEQGEDLPEQTPYLEWRNSAFNTEGGGQGQTCQDCHMPVVDQDGVAVSTRIARAPNGADFNPIGPRAPYGRHLMVGGNTLVPAILRDNAADLSPTASPAAFDATIAGARAQLEQHTAQVNLQPGAVVGGMREVAVQVVNLTGHKLPTGYPSRRVWLQAVARDAAGQVVFASGTWDVRGRILDAAGAPLPSEAAGGPVVPHADRVAGATQPAIWQSVMAESNGSITFTLLRGGHYVKDNRLLPQGWRADHADAAATAAVGVTGDANFAPGQDQVTLVLPTTATQLEVQLLYQVISPRWVAELATHNTPEVDAFLRYWAAADVRPVVLAAAQATLP